MDALIETCVNRKLEKLTSDLDSDFVDGVAGNHSHQNTV